MIKINLLPPEQRKVKIPLKKAFLITSGLVLMLLIAVYTGALVEEYFLKQELAKVNETYHQMSYVMDTKQQFDVKQQEINKRNDILVKLSKNTKSWNSLLIHLGSIMTNDVWLTDVKMNDKQVLSIRGMAASYPALAKTLKNSEKDTYFNNVNLVNSEAGKGEQDKMLTSFEIQASFKEL